MVSLENIKLIELDDNELSTIKAYCDSGLTHEVSDRNAFETGKEYNPNYMGILGEWAFLKATNKYPLELYLKRRPRFQSDRGDFFPRGHVIDIKTQKSSRENFGLWLSGRYLLNLQHKDTKKDFITDLVFSLFVPGSRIYLMGYISRKDFLLKSTERKKGEINTDNNFTYVQDCRTIDPLELHPVDEILELFI